MSLIAYVASHDRIRPAAEPMRCRGSRTSERPIGRFSDGIERLPRTQASMRVGRFSEGSESLSRTTESERVGTFADGVARNPGMSTSARVGSFGDGYRGRRAAPRRRPAAISTRLARPATRQAARGRSTGALNA